MPPLRYDRNIITDTREYTPLEIAQIQEMMKEHPVESTVKLHRLLWMDDTKVKGASLYMECIWLWEGKTTSGTTEEPHAHDFTEVIGFISTGPENPRELGARMEIILGDETHYLTKSCLVHIPAGMKHCPLTFKEVNRPVFFFTLAPISRYGRTPAEKKSHAKKKIPVFVPSPPDKSGTKYARYIITEPAMHRPSDPATHRPPPPKPTAKTTHLVSLDSDVSPGGFYVDFVWIWSGNMTMAPEPHAHDFDEMIGIVGYPDNRERPRVVGGNVSIRLADEKYPIKQSSLVYVPRGVRHCPIEFKDIKRPVLCFTVGNTPKWDLGISKKQ